jgi:hypothetical protein
MERAGGDYSRAKALYEAGMTPQGEVESRAGDLKLLENRYQEAERNVIRAQRDARLAQPIDVKLREATVLQAALALTQASKLTVRVDTNVPANQRLTAVATGVPTATVLESIATQLKLQIAPDVNGGVVLRNWPQLRVNGVVKPMVTLTAPWADTWRDGKYFSLRSLYSTSSPQWNVGKAGSKSLGWTLITPSKQAPSASFRSVPPGSGASITSVGNQVIVADPGRGPHGETGVWLTVYALNGTQLVRQSSLFHKARTEP